MPQVKYDLLLKNSIDTFLSFEIRAILISENNKWVCIFLKIKLTYLTINAIKSNLTKKRILIKDNDKVKIIVDAYDISKYHQMIDDINNNSLKLNGLNCIIKATQDIVNNKFNNLRDRSKIPPVYFYFNLTMENKEIIKYLKNIDPGEAGLKEWNDLNSLIDYDLFSFSCIQIEFPILSYFENVVLEDEDIKVTVISNEKYIQKSKLSLRIFNGRNLEANPILELSKLKDKGSNISTYEGRTNFEFKDMNYVFTIDHDELGELDQINFERSENDPYLQLMDVVMEGDRGYKISESPKHLLIDYSKIRSSDKMDFFYERLINEINKCYEHSLFTSVAVLSRKLIENLVIEILRSRYPQSKNKDHINIYYNTNQRRFRNFSDLLDELYKRKADFEPDTQTLERTINNIRSNLKMDFDANTHSLTVIGNKNSIDSYDIENVINNLFFILNKTILNK